ncbi:MAG TPA: YfhO family protein, partial [Acidimicrobiales bacterium]|nr:YfhO family protein [Acidimicrobiales bacterium]
VTLALAGTGVYVLARVLGLGVAGAAMAGTVYELSASFIGFLGWPIGGVMAWSGWLLAATVAVVRGRYRLRAVVGLALALAATVYAGQPDALVVLAPALLVFAVVLLGATTARFGGAGGTARAFADLVVAVVAGLALSAPLLLPGAQLVLGSVFIHAPRVNGALSAESVVSMLLPGYSGTSITKSQWFSVGSASYLGAIAVVLAVMGAARRRRDPGVVALSAAGAVMFVLAFAPGVSSVLNSLPFRARWHLALVLVGLAVAVLAGVGVEELTRARWHPSLPAWLAGGFGIVGLCLAALWVIGTGPLTGAAAQLRRHSFAWPAGQVALGLAVAGLLYMARRTRGARVGWCAALVLLACETASLAHVSAPVWSSSPTFAPLTADERALARTVGSSRVGFGSASCELPPTLGILPEANTLAGVRELSAYDPVTPLRLFKATHAPHAIPVSAFCPVLRTAAEARRYGVGYLLVRSGQPAPAGTVLAARIGGEDLYRVPGAGDATVTALAPSGALPGDDAPGLPVAVTSGDPATWHLVTDEPVATVLRLRLTDVPGWHASIDGRPLALREFAGAMLQARVPAGRHTIVVHYLPSAFVAGSVLAAVSAAGLLAAGAASGVRRRRRRAPGASADPARAPRPPEAASAPRPAGAAAPTAH